MSTRYPPINPKCPHMLHGGDYNPDQWPPEVWEDDMRLMKAAHCNAMSVGIFSWAQIEPGEGRCDFGWLDRIMDMLAANGAFAVLATPTAAQPAWMSRKYPEVLRTGPDRVRRLHGVRVNYCLTSPVYRDKCAQIARGLAERYHRHPALLVWHVHNEYGGACYCELCEAAFRDWLRDRYGCLDSLNQAWWTAFWGHTFTDWEEIRAPGGPYGEQYVHGMTLDWQRFTTDQTVACIRNEADVLREIAPGVPVTTNLMGTYPGLNYWKLAEALDVVSWDNYPHYLDRPGDWKTGARVSFTHDINRCLGGGRPFMMMECTPSSCNWWPAMKLKRPGLHRLTALQAVAHGSDTVQYFQWRAGRGGSEKFHGAVVDHSGADTTRVFREVAEVGHALTKLDAVVGTSVRPEAALIYDWENGWAVEGAAGPRQGGKGYLDVCVSHYRPFWQSAVPVDVVSMDADFGRYRLVMAPMLYMVRPAVADRLTEFVRAGGTFVTTFWTGIADENDLCFLGGRPGPLRKLLGIRSEEIDALCDDESVRVEPIEGAFPNLAGTYHARTYCDLIHSEGARELATYRDEFYAGRPALTVNSFGAGRAYYVAFRDDEAFPGDFYRGLIAQMGLRRVLESHLPEGVTAQVRTDGRREFVFLLNFKPEEQTVVLTGPPCTDVLTGRAVEETVALPPYGSAALERARG